jgi:type 1 glutamine amidotransferase
MWRNSNHRMGWLILAALCALVWSAASGFAQNAPAPAAGQGQPGVQGQRVPPPGGVSMPSFGGKKRIRALMVTGGCCHDYPAEAATMMKLLQNELPIDWNIAYLNWGANRDVPALYADPNWYKGYDIIVHNDCFTPPDSIVSEKYLTSAAASTRAGIPAVVIHCAMHTFRDEKTDEWRTMLGVHSVRHTAAHNIAVKVVAPQHPVMAGVKTDWVTPVDELYVLERVMPGTIPLATAVDTTDMKEYPLIWVHQTGARVFGTSLGHGADTWNDPVFQKLLVQGFRWAVGQ